MTSPEVGDSINRSGQCCFRPHRRRRRSLEKHLFNVGFWLAAKARKYCRIGQGHASNLQFGPEQRLNFRLVLEIRDPPGPSPTEKNHQLGPDRVDTPQLGLENRTWPRPKFEPKKNQKLLIFLLHDSLFNLKN